MKIYSNYSYNVSFGYDKKLNSELKTELLSYQDKKWAKTISSLNSFCNSVETSLKRAEQEKQPKDSRFQDYQDMFITAKQMLSGFVEITFENLHFADREYKHYDDEFQKRGSQEDDWRKDVCQSLNDWTSFSSVNSKKVKAESEVFVPKFDENGMEIPPDLQSQVKPKESEKPQETSVSQEIQAVLSKLAPKSMLEEFKPDVFSPKGFSDVAGMKDLKDELQNGIVQLINNPEQAQLDFEEYGKTIPRGILLYGPPGCGKTYITQALASEIESPMYMLNISKAGSRYINMTSKNIKAAFDEAAKISEENKKPCILFMDEIDSLAFDRSSRMEPDDLKQVATMLQCIDDAKKSDVIIIGATNKFNIIDPAIRRRFDSRIFIDVPDFESRKALIKQNLSRLKKGQVLLASEESIEEIARKLSGYSSSSICNISKEAALNALKRDRADIAVEDFVTAIDATTEEKPDKKLYISDSTLQKRKIGF